MLDREHYAQALEPLLAQAAGYARSLLHNRHDAEDAVQQAVLRGLEKLHTFDTTRAFKGWWLSILHNCCIDLLRELKSARTVELDGNDIAEEKSSSESDWQILVAALNRLSIDHQQILRMRYFADLSYRDLAEALDIPQGTVMSRLHLARHALAATIREEEQ